MAIDHSERIRALVKKAVKEAALGEEFGVAAEFCFAPVPVIDESGKPVAVQSGPAWFIIVTLRGTMLGQPPIGHGFPVGGILPPDDALKSVAVQLLGKCRETREAQAREALEDARAAMQEAVARK